MRILLVEDDEILSDGIVQSLTEQRYAVDPVGDGQLGWEYAQDATYDLLLMDVGLPKLDGITLCQRLRSDGCATPILLMTAKDASEERIRGLDAGADDYLIKPLNLAELQARIRALLRRGEVVPTLVLEVGALRLDPTRCEVSYEGKLLKLTPKEYSLLELFLRNPLRVFARSQMVDRVWTFDDPPLEESVKAHIKGLRRKLKLAGAGDLIENLYGLGYRLNPNVSTTPPKLDTPLQPLVNQAISPTAQSVEQSFNQKMDALWERSRGLMRERQEALQTAVDAIQAGTLSEAVRQAAGKAAHKLAGVLGMFGREEGTQLAKQIERLLEEETKTGKTQVPALVQQLVELLNLGLAQPSLPDSPSATASRLLLISSDTNLGAELRQLAQMADLDWQIVATIEEGKHWIEKHLPELVVFDGSVASQSQTGLALLAEISVRTPSIPSIVIADTDALANRIQAAAVGVQKLLTKPVTATQIWQAATQILQQSRSQSMTILAVDDDPMVLEMLRFMLEPWGMRVTTIARPSCFWEVLQTTSPDLLILDVEMPIFNGIELCRAVRTDAIWQDLPIVFLTAHRDAETVQQVFAAGADDYVTKPIIEPELLTRITNRLERSRLLRSLACRDAKTGLLNQPQSSRILEQSIQQSVGDRTPVSVLLLTLLDLSQLNVRYGHATSNQVLQLWGNILLSALPRAEGLGYWENGEFVIAMPGLKKDEAYERFSGVLNTLRRQIFTAPDGSRFQVNYSLGIAEFPTDGEQVQALYQAARAIAAAAV